jgi:phenylpropionate dioxygenase-like ring-hydroxylating dioxygenase large terminal subunit
MRHELQVELLQELRRQLREGVNADAGGLRKNPASAYTCPALAERELQTFFYQHPQLIGLSGELPGPGTFVTLADFGVEILATRDERGVFRAFLNACRHRGTMLESSRRGSKSRFSCPFHGWTYSAAGELAGIPMAQHFGEVDRAGHGLIELPAVEDRGFLWVHPDPNGVIDANQLIDGLADDMDSWQFGELILADETSYETRINWKLATDTFGETYHFKRLHRDTLAQIFHGDVLAYHTFGRNHRMILCTREIDKYAQLPEADWRINVGGFPVYFLFPNVILNVTAAGLTMVRVYPVPGEPGRSVSRLSFYFDRDKLAAEPEMLQNRAQGFGNVVQHEDYAIAETTQRAAESGLLEYVIFGRNEPPLHHYHNTFRAALGMEELPLLDSVQGD